MTERSFKVSTNLKDVIGRDLVTNKFIAVFELIKNSIDAHASLVEIELNPDKDKLYIVDNGWGMSNEDIMEKWLFVAYSAKTDGTEQAKRSSYRDRIHQRKHFAGNKGIGRFSCDTLGERTHLYSKSDSDEASISYLQIDWTKFEGDNKKEFSEIAVQLDKKPEFPKLKRARLPKKSGTVIEIQGLRDVWDEKEVKKLREFLAKLIDPFGSSKIEVEIRTHFISDSPHIENINGKIENNLKDILENKTSHIQVKSEKNGILTDLSDRGVPIFKISEESEVKLPNGCAVSANLYYLNKSAKDLFKRNMGVSSVNFGSIFLFLNGFRIFPIGEELDDTFGLNHRKQQGHRRGLGTQDVLGRIDVSAPAGVFREVSSRTGGLIEDANSIELYDFIFEKVVLPLEKYVIGVNWSHCVSAEFKHGEEFTGFENDEAKMRVLDIVGGYAKNKSVKLLDYNKNIVDIMDEKKIASDNTLIELLLDAQGNNDESLVQRINQTIARMKELEESEKSVQMLERVVEKQKTEYKSKVHLLERQTKFLERGQNLDVVHLRNIMHQLSIYASPIRNGAELGIKCTNKALKKLINFSKIEIEDLDDEINDICSNLNENSKYLSSIHLYAKMIQRIAKFSHILKKGVKKPQIVDDIVRFLSEYFAEIAYGFSTPKIHYKSDNSEFICKFSVFELAVVIDNFVDNARTAKARNIWFETRKDCAKKQLSIFVRDDGRGIDVKQIDPARIFERHYTSTYNGTGLGLHQIKQVINGWGGTVELSPSPNQTRADFIITLKEEKK